MTGPTLVEFVRARLDEDEQVARKAAARRPQIREGLRRWKPDGMSVRDDVGDLVVKHSWPHEIEHIARHDPARVLAEVAGKRLIVEAYEAEADVVKPLKDPWEDGQLFGLGRALRLLALPHADHPDYRQEWKP